MMIIIMWLAINSYLIGEHSKNTLLFTGDCAPDPIIERCDVLQQPYKSSQYLELLQYSRKRYGGHVTYSNSYASYHNTDTNCNKLLIAIMWLIAIISQVIATLWLVAMLSPVIAIMKLVAVILQDMNTCFSCCRRFSALKYSSCPRGALVCEPSFRSVLPP